MNVVVLMFGGCVDGVLYGWVWCGDSMWDVYKCRGEMNCGMFGVLLFNLIEYDGFFCCVCIYVGVGDVFVGVFWFVCCVCIVWFGVVFVVFVVLYCLLFFLCYFLFCF